MSQLSQWPGYSTKEGRGWLAKMAAQPIWDSFSTALYPQNLQDSFYWGSYLRTHYGEVVSAISRGVSYFLNGVELKNDSKNLDSRDFYTNKLIREHKINNQLLEVGLDLEFYGNSFTTVTQPITRTIVCPHCKASYYLRSLERGKDYDFSNGEFTSTCSACHKRGVFIIKDHPDVNAAKPLNIIRWNPLSIDIDHCSITNAEKIKYLPTKQDRAFLSDTATSTVLETVPLVLLDALVNDKALEFYPDTCIHLAMPADCMLSDELGGWGVPPFLPAFRYVVMMMLLDRQTEAVVKDFILPIRLLFPGPTAVGGSDPIANTNIMHMGAFRQSVENALKAQAYQQSSWQLIPAPVQQLQLGGDGKAIIPVELLRFAKEQLLDALNVPVELYQSSTNNSTAGNINAMRLFEQTRLQRVELLEDYLSWYLKRCTEMLAWPVFNGSIIHPSISQDPQKLQMLMQLRSENIVSGITLARMFGVEPAQERTRILEEQVEQARLQKQIQQTINNSDIMNSIQTMAGDAGLQMAADAEQQSIQGQQQGGAAAPPPPDAGGGAMMPPPPGGAPVGGTPEDMIKNLKSMMTPDVVTPDQLNTDADVVADILMHTPLGIPRNRIYDMVRTKNPTLHAIAKSKLAMLEQKSRQDGIEQARQG